MYATLRSGYRYVTGSSSTAATLDRNPQQLAAERRKKTKEYSKKQDRINGIGSKVVEAKIERSKSYVTRKDDEKESEPNSAETIADTTSTEDDEEEVKVSNSDDTELKIENERRVSCLKDANLILRDDNRRLKMKGQALFTRNDELEREKDYFHDEMEKIKAKMDVLQQSTDESTDESTLVQTENYRLARENKNYYNEVKKLKKENEELKVLKNRMLDTLEARQTIYLEDKRRSDATYLEDKRLSDAKVTNLRIEKDTLRSTNARLQEKCNRLEREATMLIDEQNTCLNYIYSKKIKQQQNKTRHIYVAHDDSKKLTAEGKVHDVISTFLSSLDIALDESSIVDQPEDIAHDGGLVLYFWSGGGQRVGVEMKETFPRWQAFASHAATIIFIQINFANLSKKKSFSYQKIESGHMKTLTGLVDDNRNETKVDGFHLLHRHGNMYDEPIMKDPVLQKVNEAAIERLKSITDEMFPVDLLSEKQPSPESIKEKLKKEDPGCAIM